MSGTFPGLTGIDYTQTPNLGLFKPIANMAVGFWGDLWNSNADTIDSAIHVATGGGPYLPLAGNATVFGPTTFSAPLNYSATGGGTAVRSAQDRARDWLNVLDYGAVMDGATNNLAAFNAARAAAVFNGAIQVPRGSTAFPNGISAGIATPVLWQLDGTTFPGGSAPITTIGMPGDVVEGFFNGNKYFGKRNALKGPGAVVRVDLIQTDTTGGNTNDLVNGINVIGQQNYGNTNQQWLIAAVSDSYGDTPGGGVVGIQSTVRKHSGAQCWAVQTVALDDTGLPTSANGHGLLGVEFATRAHNIDDGANIVAFGGVGIRKGMHITCNRSTFAAWQNARVYPAGQIAFDAAGNTSWKCATGHTSAATPTTFAQDRTANPTYWTANGTGNNPDDETGFSNAIMISGDSAATKTYIGSVYGLDTTVSAYSVFDARGAYAPFNYSGNPVAAVRMSAGQIVDFNGGPALNSVPGAYLQYRTATQRLYYVMAGVDVWSVDASGNVRAKGTVTASTTP